MIANIVSNKKLEAAVKELIFRCRKLNISLVFITVLFFYSKRLQIKLNFYLIMKINTKTELRNIAINHSADIDYNDFLKIYSECAKELFFEK